MAQLSEKAKENKIKYTMEYNKTHYKRVPLDVTPAMYEDIKNASVSAGETVNGYIKKAIEMRLNK